MIDRILAVVSSLFILSSCASNTAKVAVEEERFSRPSVSESCPAVPLIDLSPLRECNFPSHYPSESFEMIVAIWQQLELCVGVSKLVLDNYENMVKGSDKR